MSYILFDTNLIKLFLEENKDNLNKSEYHEILCGLILTTHFKFNNKVDPYIGFQVSGDLYRSLPKKGGITDTITLKKIVEHHKRQDTHIDIALTADTPVIAKDREIKNAILYQMKRFRENMNGDSTLPLIKYLNEKIPLKYAKNKTNLVICLEKTKLINLPLIAKNFNPDRFPFRSVMFIIIEVNYVYVGEIWPRQGISKYNADKLI